MFHYVYKIYWKSRGLRYYGARSCQCHPSEDLGVVYFSSSTDGEFIKKQKIDPEDFKYTILFETCDRKSALELESKLHMRIDAASHPMVLNKSNQTGSSFNYTKGKQKHNKYIFIHKDGSTIEETPRNMIKRGLVSSHIYAVVRGTQNHTNGWSLKKNSEQHGDSVRLDRKAPHHFYDKRTNRSIICSIEDLSDIIDSLECKVERLVKGHSNSHKGIILYKNRDIYICPEKYEFMYKDDPTVYFMTIGEIRSISDPVCPSPYQLIDGSYKTSNGWRLKSTSLIDTLPRTREDKTKYSTFSLRSKTKLLLTRKQIKDMTGAGDGAVSMFIKGKSKTLGKVHGLVLYKNKDHELRCGQDFSIYHFYNTETKEGFVGNRNSFNSIIGEPQYQISKILRGKKTTSPWILI